MEYASAKGSSEDPEASTAPRATVVNVENTGARRTAMNPIIPRKKPSIFGERRRVIVSIPCGFHSCYLASSILRVSTPSVVRRRQK
jgi:hypothetical protein